MGIDLYNLVISAKLQKGGGGDEPVLIDKTITANGTYNASSDNADGYKKVVANVPSVTPTGNINITSTAQTDVSAYATAQVVDADLVASNIKKDVDILGVVGTYEGGGGGGGLGTLLASKSLGNITHSSSTETVVDTITISDAANYDVFFAIVKGDSIINSRHYASASFAYLYGTSDRAHSSAGTTGYSVSSRWNCIANNLGNLSTAYSGKGIYISSPEIDKGNVTLKILVTYSSSQTGVINNDYSVEIYGINLCDLIA